MGAKTEDDLAIQFVNLIERHKAKRIHLETKNNYKKTPSKYLLAILAFFLISILTITWEPETNAHKTITDYPVNQSSIAKIVVETVSSDDSFPIIRIGPGCSINRPVNCIPQLQSTEI